MQLLQNSGVIFPTVKLEGRRQHAAGVDCGKRRDIAVRHLSFRTAVPQTYCARNCLTSLRNAVDATRSGLLTYESLRNLSEVIGGEYGDRVIFELIQNAHDAHQEGKLGCILLRLVLRRSRPPGIYISRTKVVASTGATSMPFAMLASPTRLWAKGLGNKGLGFRSVETLTDDPRIYSQPLAKRSERFDGYCFRFAKSEEVLQEVSAIAEPAIARKVASTLPRYLAAIPVTKQSEQIRRFAREGFATVVPIPLRSENSVSSGAEASAGSNWG